MPDDKLTFNDSRGVVHEFPLPPSRQPGAAPLDPERAYILDDIDVRAKEIYARSGFQPPTRTTGFHYASERSIWDHYRQLAREEMERGA